MHYYQFNISDFALHTSHLTLEEEAVYRRLLDHYYDTEKPIPKETQRVIRRLRLGSYVSEVEQILGEFFTLEDDGYHNYRADFEIAEYQTKAETARQNGKKGGRPRKNKGAKTQSVNLANPEETGSKANYELGTMNYELKPAKEKSVDKKKEMEEAFEVFYFAGMKKTVKKAAFKVFEKIAGDNPMQFAEKLALDIKARLSNQQMGFDKMYPTTYLNGARWEDELTQERPSTWGSPKADFSFSQQNAQPERIINQPMFLENTELEDFNS